MLKALDPLKLLRMTLNERCRTNPRYSIRAFARSTGISHTVLSLVLSGKRNLSKKATEKLADHLNLDPERRQALMQRHSPQMNEFETLSMDAFELISDWYHYAILSALRLPGSGLEAKWLSKQLGITPLQARLAIDRLKRLGLVGQNESGAWEQISKPIKIDNKHSTSATKKFHKQLLIRAAESIDKDPVSQRDFSSMTFAMSASHVEHARKRIQNFRRELASELQNLGSPDAVFNFTIQLYPITPLKKTENP